MGDDELLDRELEHAKKDIESGRWAKDSGERFVMKGPGIIGKKGQISREAAEEGKKHFRELEKLWGVKFEPYPLPGDPDYEEDTE